jgi:hypothetical protein
MQIHLAFVCKGAFTIVQMKVAGDGSTLPAMSVEYTSKVCATFGFRFVYVIGLVQLDGFEPSILHVKFAMPKLSVPVNLKLIDVEDVEPPFGIDVPLPSILEVMVVSGGLLSGANTCMRWLDLSAT